MPRMNLGLPFDQCNLPTCLHRTGLLRCGACGVAVYCGAEHQRADRPRHKASCGLVKQARETYRKEDDALRASEGDLTTPANPFETAVGRFWLCSGTRPYMRARFDLMTAVLNIRTGEAVDIALVHALDMLRLCRGDNLSVRSHVPALYLRLGRDQEAYDFIKWFAVRADNYDWGDMSLPFLNLRQQDALEMLESWGRIMELSLLVSLTLIKIRLMLDLMLLQAAVRKKGSKSMSSEEKMALVEEEAMSDVLLSRPDIVNQDSYEETIAGVSRQVYTLYELVKKRNKYFWPAILNPGPYSHAVPAPYIHGSEEEVLLVFRESWYSWAESEAAITAIREVIREEH